MPHSLVGWSESADFAALDNVAALADSHITVQGDVVRVPSFATQLIGVFAASANITRAQLQSPTLRRLLNLEVSPLNVGAEPLNPPPIAMHPRSPIPLQEDEDLTLQIAHGAGIAERMFGLAWLADGPLLPVDGQIHSVRVTNATTLTANAWSNGALTFDQTLPPGEYAVVGAAFESAGLVAFRLVFPGGFFRPGGIGGDAPADIEVPGQRRGGWGEWGRFRHTTPPTVDFLSVSADSSQTGELDLIKVG